MTEKVRLYRHYSAAQLDSDFVKISLKLQSHNKGWGSKPLTVEKVEALERLLVLIDEERDHRFPPITK